MIMSFGPWRSSAWSLTQRQLAVVGGCLSALALLLGVGGALFINRVAEGMSDHLLAGAAQSVADTLAVEKGEPTLEISPNVLAMLANGGRNRVFYSVFQGPRFLTGYDDFPVAAIANRRDGDLSFRYAKYLGIKVRVATAVRQLPRTPAPTVIQIAASLDETHALARRMLIGLALLETVLVGFAIFLLWPAMRWALRPVTVLQRHIDSRPPSIRATQPLDPATAPVELASLISAFNDLLGRIDQAADRMSRFTADASHQMRTPLAALRAHIDLLRHARSGGDSARASIDDIDGSALRLQRLVTQLLALSKAEGATNAAWAPPVDAVAIARDTCLRLATAAHRAGLEMRFAVDGELAIRLEPELLSELLANLIDNSLKYHLNGTFVLVTVNGSSEHGSITVEDDGQGIPAAEISRVGERFFRSSRDHNQPGSGLGLSIARAICERAGGVLSVTSETAPSSFRVTLSF